MKLLLIAPINSIHTVRWANSLINYVDELTIASMHDIRDEIDPRIVFHKLPLKAPFGYITNAWTLKKIIKKTKPDIIHTHFLSGYGTLAAISVNKNKTNHLLSMWGSDIYDFPRKSYFHKILINWVCSRASSLASTSFAMKNEFHKIYPKNTQNISVTPFGVETKLFCPNSKNEDNENFIIGIAKNIENKYGIKYLIEGFKLFTIKYPKSELHIIGEGSKLKELKDLSITLKLEDKIIFHGRKRNQDLPQYLNTWNVCVIPSILESFGVSAIEASSCGLPVIASNVGGLPEVVEDGVTGYIIPSKNPQAIAEKLELLFMNKEIGEKMGQAGRKMVLEKYDWNENVQQMVHLYKKKFS